MNNLTEKGLTEYVLDIYNNKKTIYMHGASMLPVSQSFINSMARINPVHYPKERQKKLAAAVSMDYFGTDGAGLIKSYYWGGIGSPRYRKAEDFSAEELFASARTKEKITTLPERTGVILFSDKEKHIGIYIGAGLVIESTLSERGDGVSKSKLQAFPWEYWFECFFIKQ